MKTDETGKGFPSPEVPIGHEPAYLYYFFTNFSQIIISISYLLISISYLLAS